MTRLLPSGFWLAALLSIGCGGSLGGDAGDGDGDEARVDAGVVTCEAEESSCGSACCGSAQICVAGSVCVDSSGPCDTSNDCQDDSYCLEQNCVPYGTPADHTFDDTCTRRVDIDEIVPEVQCRWTAPPTGDAHPNHFQVMSTPVVVDFDFDADASTLSPSIVFTSFPTLGSYAQPGVVRVIRGDDCEQQYSIDAAGDAALAPSAVAVGDLDGDGHAEIVAPAHGGGMLAFRYDAPSDQFVRMWRSGSCTGGNRVPDNTGSASWSGPSIHDLDDDGSPEIIYGATVYGADGCLRTNSLGFPAYSRGIVPTIADVDEDGAMELVMGNGIYQWDSAASNWVAESYYSVAGTAGHVAIAEMGHFPLAAFGGADKVEVAVVSAGTARVQTLDGTIVFGPIEIPGGGTSGPPTIADFDGDGRRELATAGGGRFVVLDLDCVAGGDPAQCQGQARTTGILWSQPSQDISSGVTGSSVFDFDANGSAEAVYADECYLRIYDGTSGDVVYSAARSSGTTYENPVIADVDGDYRTEIVSSVNSYAGTLGCPGTDPLDPTASFELSHGIVVLRDRLDRWASSRPVWNQHAYAVTHVGDHGEIPRTSEVQLNWLDPELNNFRQNVQGDLEALGVADLTLGEGAGVKCDDTVPRVWTQVCNRGTQPVPTGADVVFHEGAADGAILCTAALPGSLTVGDCMEVECEAAVLTGRATDVYVVADESGLTEECYEGNNSRSYDSLGCTGIE